LFGSLQNRDAIASLIFARIVYAVNWLNVGAIFVLMRPELGVGVGGLGALTSAFYIGIGLMQIPGGLLAAKWGAKKIVVVGISLSSFATLGTSIAPSLVDIALLRFLVGMGMAFVFAPGVVLVAELFAGKSGSGVGLFNSAYNFGGLVGIFGWLIIATSTGWRPSLALSGALGVASGVLVLVFVPSGKARGEFRVEQSMLYRILGDRRLILLGLATLGFGVCNLLISIFMVEYLVSSLALSKPAAGLVASMVLIIPIFTAIWGGRLYDRLTKPRRLMVLSLVGGSFALGLTAFPTWYAALACSVLGGFVSGIGFTFAFAAARDLSGAAPEYDGLAIAWVNSISLTGSFFAPLFYSYVVAASGYSAAWLWSGALSLVFLIPLLGMGNWSKG
jgi:MFS family permease